MCVRDLTQDSQRSSIEEGAAKNAAELDLDYALVDRVYDVTPDEMRRARRISALADEQR